MKIANFKFGRTCPNCQKNILKLKEKSLLTFCPHCHILLYPKPIDTKPKKRTPKWLALIIAITIGFAFYSLALFPENPIVKQIVAILVSSGIFLFFLILIILLLALTIFRNLAINELQMGVDTLEEIKEDSCNYFVYPHPNGIEKVYQCSDCNSFRLVDLYWYKRILSKHHKEFPKLSSTCVSLGEKNRFVGCLHCTAKYELQPTKVFDNAERNFAIGLVVFFIIIFGFNSQVQQLINWFLEVTDFTPMSKALFWSIVIASHIYWMLTSANMPKTLPKNKWQLKRLAD